MFGDKPETLKMTTKLGKGTVWLFSLTLWAICISSNAQDIIGCGGFVMSEVEINFSIIEVKLYTKQGSLKYQTDCAPNTGYYMVPVYDKGDYILKVEPPPGWTFEPESVELHIDGTTDQCSKSQDINFRFTGFGIVGKVLSKGHSSGPSGVTIILKSTNNAQMIHRTTSVSGGSFTFEKVLPGEYVVTGEHSKWIFDKASETVVVGRDSGKSGTFITVQGYNVQGRVTAENEPIAGVIFLLYSEDGVESEELRGCQPYELAGLTSDYPRQPICFLHSEEDGVFEFGALPCGKYFLMPLYRGDGLLFDVVPKKMPFTVNHDSVKLKEAFRVVSVSIRGYIRYISKKEKGKGVPNAQVLLNGQPKAKTDKNGEYTLKHLTTGQYSIDVTADDLAFNTTSVKVSSLHPILPEMIVARFSVCGQVIIDKLPEGLSNLSKQRKVTYHVKGQKKVVAEVITEEDGRFCAQLPPGAYLVKVILTELEKGAGLKLAPTEREVRVVDLPVKDVKFSQFRAQVTGKIHCLDSCGPLQLSLVAIGRTDDRQTVQSQTFTDGSRYTFHNVMPGKYKVSLLKEEWCWKKGSLEVEVTDRDVVESEEFSQSGYILSCSLSHNIMLNFSQENKKENVGSFNLTKGVNKFCLSQPGLYKLTPVSCHRFEQDVYQYDTSSPQVLSLTAVSHRVLGAVVMQEQQDDVIITIGSSLVQQPTSIGPLKLDLPPTLPPAPSADKKGKEKAPPPPPAPTGPFVYKFQHWAKDGEKLTISASSKVFLFTPPSVVATIQGDTCPGELARFEGKKGIFIVGQIQPQLKGVQIQIFSQSDPEAKYEITTDDKGAYKVGPLHSDQEYNIEAGKDGYILTAISGNHGHFKAFKLGEVQVKVADNAGESLGGVLLSLSGGQGYRRHNLTHANGTMGFIGLSPGQYYLLPLMKEYRFEPSSQMIEVTEGATLSVKIDGKRVAFSCFGSVTSLNGEAEQEVHVEAVGLGSEECQQLQEESITEQDGTFRIRGLQPHCEYAIRLQTGNVNNHIERAAPTSRVVKLVTEDLEGINIIAFRRMNQMDLSGNIVTLAEYLPSLKVHLYREDNQDSPLHSTSLTSTPFFYLPSLKIDSQDYVLRLESTLSKASFEHSTTVTEVYFTANSTYRHFTFTFSPKRKLFLEQELSQASIIALPFTLLCLYLAYNYKKVAPVLMQNLMTLKTLATKTSSPDSSANKPTIPVDIQFVPKKQKLRKT